MPFTVEETDEAASASLSLSLGVVLALCVSVFLIVSCLTIAFHATKFRRFIRNRLSFPANLSQACFTFLVSMVDFIIGDKPIGSRNSGNYSNLSSASKWSRKILLKNSQNKSSLAWKLRFLDTTFVKTRAGSGIVTGSHMLADPRKANTLGEDACFVSGYWAGIADGVGGWRSQGVDPGKFSRALMIALGSMVAEMTQKCSTTGISVEINDTSKNGELESQDTSSKKKPVDNQPSFKMDELIRTGFQSVVATQRRILAALLASPKKRVDVRDSVIQGSSTVLIYNFDVKRSILHCGNIGDCELLVLRQVQPNSSTSSTTDTSQNSTNDNNTSKKVECASYGIIDRVAPGCFSFNMPHQIGMQLIGSSLDIIDCPHITVQKIRVQSGDIVISGSDGLFDNVFEDEILEMTGQFVHNTKQEVDSLDKANWEKLAKNLTKLAIRYGKDRKYLSPFAVKASEVSGTKMRGGKLDDTTVLVSYIA